MNPAGDDQQQLAFLRARRAARVCAMRCLYQLDQAGKAAAEPQELERFWEQAQELAEELGLATPAEFAAARAYGNDLIRIACNQRESLDTKIALASRNWTLDRMGSVDRNLLRVAAAEMLFLQDATPPLAALDEAIELAKEYGDRQSARFVNGILDALLKAAT
ncbi:MAG: transcription antitermination factor NusB [Lentisphaeria bacterium]|jgi:N utilization substance protein B